MHKLLYMEMSLNGLICREDDTVTWTEAAWNSYFAACQKYGNLIIGKKSFETIPPEEADSMSKLKLVVVSKTLAPSAAPNYVSHVASSPEAALSWLSQNGFNKALIGGGSKLNAAFLAAGLVDEIAIDIEPIMYRSGKPFCAKLPKEIGLRLTQVKQTGPDSVQLRYRVER